MIQVLLIQAALTVGQAPAQPTWTLPAHSPRQTAHSPRSHSQPRHYVVDEGAGTAEAPKDEKIKVMPHAPESKNGKATTPHYIPLYNGHSHNGNGDCADCKEEENGCDCEECKEDDCSWCNLGDPWKLADMFLCKDSPFDVGGWFQAGYHTQSTGAIGGAPRVPGNMFNNQPDRINLHQAWAYIERKADGKCGLDWGFRADFIYGIDGVDTQAFGGRPGTWDFRNGWGEGDRESSALPVLYGEVAYGDFSLRAGKFYTLIGYETVRATGNFFYSHAFSFYFSEPFTHTGALATWKASDNLSFRGGWVAGNDTAFDSLNGGHAFLGIVSYTINDNMTASYAVNFGDLGANGNGIHQTVLLTTTFMENFEWVLQSDYAKHDQGGAFDSFQVANYLFYTINDCLKLGSRMEWYKLNGVSYYNATAGLNYFPMANLRIRPEFRYQWSPGAERGNNPIGVPVDRGIFGVDVIFTF